MDDTIYREAAIYAVMAGSLSAATVFGRTEEGMTAAKEIIRAIKSIPSAQPETARRIVGKSRDGMTMWYQCDMCNEPVDIQDAYCSGCGRRLTDEAD